MELELNLNKDAIKKQFTLNFISKSKEKILLNEKIFNKATIFEKIGFKAFDSLHLAVADFVGVKFFITTDNKLIKLAKRYSNKINYIVMNPTQFVEEIR